MLLLLFRILILINLIIKTKLFTIYNDQKFTSAKSNFHEFT